MQKYFVEARQLLALAIPVILAQVAQTAMGFVDTVMAGGYSATDMAAVAIGTSIWLPAILFGHGLLLALTPVVAQLNGSGRRERIAPQVRQGFWLAGFVSVLIMVVLWNAGYIISSMHNIDPLLAEKAVGYLRALLWGAPGYLFFEVARNQCEGLAKPSPGWSWALLITGQHSGELYFYLWSFRHARAGRRRLRCGDGLRLLGDVRQHAVVGAPGAYDARYPLRRALQRP